MGGFDAIDHRFTELYERAAAVLGADKRVDALEVGGSVAAGSADQWSDLDLHIVASVDDYEEFLADWPNWLAMITPTVFARTPIAPLIINAVTTDGLTLDLAVYKGQAARFPPVSAYTVGMLSAARFGNLTDALEYAVAEQLRGLAGPFISLVQRDEHLRHLTGIPHLIGLLTTVFLAELDAPPPTKHWNQTFTTEQLAAAAALPTLGATREGVADFGLALARLLIGRARPLFADRGLEWPAPLARVAADRLRDCLGIETADWLY